MDDKRPDKSDNVLLDVQHQRKSIVGLDPEMLHEVLRFVFNGRTDLAEIVGCRSFCSQDENGRPIRLNITLDLKPCDVS